jgi:polysaccharide biosynthesis/export protein
MRDRSTRATRAIATRATRAIATRATRAIATRATSMGWVAALTLVFGVGCATEGSFVSVQDLPMSSEVPGLIGPRDVILVAVRNQPALSGEFPVGDHGEYSQPTLGTIAVAGRTTDAVVADLQGRLKDLLVKPDVTVSIVKTATVRVNVVGEVKTPGSYELTRGRGVIPALAAAGWMTEFANGDRIFVIRTDAGRVQRIRFKARELTTAEPHATGFRLQDGDVVVVE